MSGLTAQFVVDDTHALPAEAHVEGWVGNAWQPVQGQQNTWGHGTTPTRMTFTSVSTTPLRLGMRSGGPLTPRGFLGLRS